MAASGNFSSSTSSPENVLKTTSNTNISVIPMAEKMGIGTEASKNFTHDQKVSIIQSILQTIPREQVTPWNFKKPAKATPAKLTAVSGDNKVADPTTVSQDLFKDADVGNEELREVNPPLPDPYAKSMKYYEKHLILNHFQHMTAKLALHRPKDTLDYMIEWCKSMQQKHQALKDVTAQQLFDNSDYLNAHGERTATTHLDKDYSFEHFGNTRTVSHVATAPPKVNSTVDVDKSQIIEGFEQVEGDSERSGDRRITPTDSAEISGKASILASNEEFIDADDHTTIESDVISSVEGSNVSISGVSENE